MKRVIGLYRIPWFPFFRGKLSRIEEMLSYQGKVVSVDRQELVDAADQTDMAEGDYGDDAHSGGEEEYGEMSGEGGGDEVR